LRRTGTHTVIIVIKKSSFPTGPTFNRADTVIISEMLKCEKYLIHGKHWAICT
jgi:hypothetical protein